MQGTTCKNHPDAIAADRCTGCAEAFCPNCLVNIQGKKYCGSCKIMAIQGYAPLIDEAAVPCETANEALKYALFGLICFGIILEPIAISKAMKARQEIAADPTLTGSGKANAALVIALIGLLLWAVGLVSRASSKF